jgi:hypothetical protein
MTPRTSLALASVAGLAGSAGAQEVMVVSYTWSEVIAGTLTPVSSPNSVLEPGEGARIGINLFASLNGTSAIGQTTTYTPPPPPGVGTIRGISGFTFHLVGDLNASTAQGTWNSLAISSVFSFGSYVGNPLNNGSQVDSLGGAQHPLPGQTANATNPVIDAWRGVWSPVVFSNRTVNFRVQLRTELSDGFLLQYGSAYLDPNDPTTEYALYVEKLVSTDVGSGINIPIAPAPATAWAAACALAAAGRRRRQ